jgi:hypothetical protein
MLRIHPHVFGVRPLVSKKRLRYPDYLRKLSLELQCLEPELIIC